MKLFFSNSTPDLDITKIIILKAYNGGLTLDIQLKSMKWLSIVNNKTVILIFI